MPRYHNSVPTYHRTLDETSFVSDDRLSEMIERGIALIAQLDMLCLHLQGVYPQCVLNCHFRLPVCVDELDEIAADLGDMQHVCDAEGKDRQTRSACTLRPSALTIGYPLLMPGGDQNRLYRLHVVLHIV